MSNSKFILVKAEDNLIILNTDQICSIKEYEGGTIELMSNKEIYFSRDMTIDEWQEVLMVKKIHTGHERSEDA